MDSNDSYTDSDSDSHVSISSEEERAGMYINVPFRFYFTAGQSETYISERQVVPRLAKSW